MVGGGVMARWKILGLSLFTLGICYFFTSHLLAPEDNQHLEEISSSACETSIRPTRIERHNDVWQILKAANDDSEVPAELAIFGAYMDDRESVSSSGVLRVFTVASVPDDARVICQLWYDNDNTTAKELSPAQVVASHENVGRGLKIRSVKYQERLYTCPLPPGRAPKQRPVNVSLAFEHCAQSTTLVEIVYPAREQVHQVGVCVAVSYGTLDPYRLVEWIELNRLLGVGEFNFYDSRLHKSSRQVLEYYQEHGIVRLRPSAPAVPSWCFWCQKLSVIPAFNDCLYRNLYRYKHTLVIDVDEFVIPKQDNDLNSLIEHLNRGRSSDFPALMFRNAYFFMDFEYNRNSKDSEGLVSVRYLNRLTPSKQNYSPKSLLNPRQCVVVQNHYCAVRTPEVGNYWTGVIPPELALSHHYKKCHYKKDQCKDLEKKKPVRDATTLRYEKPLRKEVNKVAKLLKIKQKHS